MQGEFSTLTLREGFTIRKGSKVVVPMSPTYKVELKVTRIYLNDNGMIYVECVTKQGVGAIHSAVNLSSYGVLKKY